MRILAHVHTFNDEAVLARALRAIEAQSRAVDGIVIVDNGSTDSTLDRDFGAAVTILRHEQNLGTNGAVRTGMSFALENGYDWVWVFDADSAPRPTALEKLLEFYEGLSQEQRDHVLRVCSLPVDVTTGVECHGMTITRRGFELVDPPAGGAPYECLGTHWSGSLFRLEAVRRVGLPPLDYVLDWGDHEYGYRGSVQGYKTYMVPASITDHNTDGVPTFGIHTRVGFGPVRFGVVDFPPIRLYYITRNTLYFWLHEHHERGLRQTLHVLPSWAWVFKHIIKFALVGRWRELAASLRGIRDGVFARMDRRY